MKNLTPKFLVNPKSMGAENIAASAKRPEAIRIDLSSESRGGIEFQHELIRHLDSKGLPEFMIESERLVRAGDNTQSDTVINYIKDLLDKLAIANTGQPSPELEIVLSDTHGIKAGVITRSKTPIMIVGLGLIDFLVEKGFGEDQLVGILGHERFHLRRHEKWPDLKNGRPEETVGDIYGIHEAEQAGYNPQALGDMFRAIKEEYKIDGYRDHGLMSSVRDVIDEHPNIDDRIRHSELAMANLQLTKRMTEVQTAIPEDIIEAAHQSSFKTRFDRFKDRKNYQNTTSSGRINIVGQYFYELAERKGNYFLRTDYFAQLCYRQMDSEIKKLRHEDGITKAAGKWFNHFMRRGGNYPLMSMIALMGPKPIKIAKDAEDSWRAEEDGFDYSINEHEIVPKVFRRKKTDLKAFWNAETLTEAAAAVRRLEQAEIVLERYNSGISILKYHPSCHSWPDRRDIENGITKKNPVILPWEKHLGWVLEDQENKTDKEGADLKLIKKTLKKYAPDDPRIPGYKYNEYGSNPYDYKFDRLVFDESGHITEIKPTKKELQELERDRHLQRFVTDNGADLIEREYALQKEREKSEKKLVEMTDWSEMEDDFWKFVENHKDSITPPSTIIPGRFPFAIAFAERLENLVEKDHNKWRKVMVQFLTGYEPGVREAQRNKRNDDADNVTFHPLCFLRLVQEFEQKYINRFGNDRDFYAKKRGELPDNHPMAAYLNSIPDPRRVEVKRDFDFATNTHTVRKVYPSKRLLKNQPILIPFTIDRHHPFAKMILKLNHSNDTTPIQKSSLIGMFDYRDPYTTSIDGYFKFNPRTILRYHPPMTAQGFNKLENQMKGRTYQDNDMIWREVSGIEILKMFQKLDALSTSKRVDVSSLNFFLITSDFKYFQNKTLSKSIEKELKVLVNRQLQRNQRIDFSKNTPLDELIERFIRDNGKTSKYSNYFDDKVKKNYRYAASFGIERNDTHNIFSTRPDLERQYKVHIQKRVMALPVAERSKYLTQLMEMQIQDPEYRDWAIDSWVESTTDLLGIDNGSVEYEKRALGFIKHTVKLLDSAQGMNAVVKLLEGIEAQRFTALGAKEILTEVFGRKFLEKDGAMRTIDSAVSTCSHDPELREEFLKYISEPLSYDNTRAFADLLKTKVVDEYDEKFVSQFFNPQKRINMTPTQENMVVDNLHHNFWAMPFGLRTIYLDKMLFPVKEDINKIFDNSVSYVLDKVLPVDKKFAPEAREALLIYLDCCPPELRRVTFSAILATVHQDKDAEQLRPGQVLSNVLTRTGAAGGQILQAGHSYLSGMEISDPDLLQFRDDLKSSKTSFSPPLPWETFERIDEVLPGSLWQMIKHVKPVKDSSGSTAYVAECEKYDGTVSAIKLMRKDVLPIADLQFERFLKAFNELAERHSIYRPLPSMVSHANEMIKVAANGNIGAAQVNYAEKVYEPIQIYLNDTKYDFDVAAVKSSGTEYLETEFITGAHLNDLEIDSEDRTARSIIIETTEWYRTLKGEAVDEDRHGGQNKNDEAPTIGIFDVGALPYNVKNNQVDVPSTDKKRSLGRVLGLTMNASLAGQPAIEAFINSVTLKEWGSAKSYLVGIQKGLLARADVHAGFGETIEERAKIQEQIFSAVWQKGHIDRDIFEGMIETISLGTIRKLFTTPAENNTEWDIKISDKSSYAVPFLDRTQIAKAIARSGTRRIFNAFSRGSSFLPANDNTASPVQELKLKP